MEGRGEKLFNVPLTAIKSPCCENTEFVKCLCVYKCNKLIFGLGFFPPLFWKLQRDLRKVEGKNQQEMIPNLLPPFLKSDYGLRGEIKALNKIVKEFDFYLNGNPGALRPGLSLPYNKQGLFNFAASSSWLQLEPSAWAHLELRALLGTLCVCFPR